MENGRIRPDLIVAIDGPAGAGKSTVAKMLAQRLGYLYINTGAMYRCVALKAIREGADAADVGRLSRIAQRIEIALRKDGGVYLDGEDVTSSIRDEAVSRMSSRVSAIEVVRREMVKRQREMGKKGGVVLEGRDIGTVVFPEAQVKIYLDAHLEERSRRRWLDLKGTVSLSEVEHELISRDRQDSDRSISPLKRADDAAFIDSTHLTPQEVVEKITELISAYG
jgi:cytidylate kinase